MSGDAVFLDSGIFIAFLDRTDGWHAEALGLFSEPPRRWFTSLAVVSETYGWFLHRLGEDAARRFRLALDDLPRLARLGLDAEHDRAAARRLERHRGRRLTHVDASSLCFLEARRIRTVWGTDLDLAIEGARVLPVGS